MNDTEAVNEPRNSRFNRLPILAAFVALIGLGDAIYLTVHHYKGEKLPCGLTGGCDAVLSSSYSEIGGIPLAAFGAVAYFVAFSLAVLAAYGNRLMWKIFGLQATLMMAFSAWLVYLQAFVILQYCQFCLLSALTSATLFLLAMISRFWRF
jgi:uncharacterized membrane protein